VSIFANFAEFRNANKKSYREAYQGKNIKAVKCGFCEENGGRLGVEDHILCKKREI